MKKGKNMSNKKLFKSVGLSRNVPVSNAVNAAGGKAYAMSAKQALATIAATNCFNSTFYVNAEANLAIAKEAALNLKDDPKFIAQVAVYARSHGYMKDMPAFLCVILAGLDTKLFRKVFRQVIDNGKMLGNFVAIARSGATGRVLNLSSSSVRKAIAEWFRTHTSEQVFRGSVGIDISMRDILAMARPRPDSEEKATLFAYLKGTEFDKESRTFRQTSNKVVVHTHSFDSLPAIVKQYEAYKSTREGEMPKVDFRLLDSLGLSDKEWTAVASNAGWTMTRMNLNTFARHGVFKDKAMAQMIAARLRNPEEIAKARIFPYQLMAAWNATQYDSEIPFGVRDALQDAMEVAVDNVPSFDGQIYVAIDTSGSMKSPVTGHRYGSSSSVRCIDAASLFAAAILRKNRDAVLIPFDTHVHDARSLNGRDSVMTNADKLARFGGGGTNCSCVLEFLNAQQAKGDAVIYISDNESWIDSGRHYYGEEQGVRMQYEWERFRQRNKAAKLVCIDLTPEPTSQVQERSNVLQIGGFSDTVFDVVQSFLKYGIEVNHWVSEIEKIDLDAE